MLTSVIATVLGYFVALHIAWFILACINVALAECIELILRYYSYFMGFLWALAIFLGLIYLIVVGGAWIGANWIAKLF